VLGFRHGHHPRADVQVLACGPVPLLSIFWWVGSIRVDSKSGIQAKFLADGSPDIMEIAFRTKALRTVCLSKESMDKRYGAEGGALLRRRLADIRAAECLGEVPLLTMSPVCNSPDGEVAIVVGAGLILVVRANHQSAPKLKGGGVDWARVDRILIQRIEHAHG
jgi:hypothetical protein